MMSGGIRRREFVAALCSTSAVGPLAALAQGKLPTVGLLIGATPSVQAQWTEAFVQRLGELGWIKDKTVTLQSRWVEGRFEKSPAIIAEFVRLNVDVIVTHATGNVLAAKQVTSTIPIVFASAADPVGNGLVGSLARPGGNVTGVASQGSDLAHKLVELLRDLIPNLRRVAVLYRVGNPLTAQQAQAAKAAGEKFGIEVAFAEIRGAADIGPVIHGLGGRSEALIVPSDPLNNTNRVQIIASALQARLPSVYLDRDYVEAGGLMSYGPNWPRNWRRSADYVDKILRGAKPAELPVEQPMSLELVINLKTAKALGLQLPRILLARADDVIE
jgi:ABC-type uncharacterized transport system substrate-binding protein